MINPGHAYVDVKYTYEITHHVKQNMELTLPREKVYMDTVNVSFDNRMINIRPILRDHLRSETSQEIECGVN